jgi:hypothetical protein
MRRQSDWTMWAAELTGLRFGEFLIGLTQYNATRFEPAVPEDASPYQLKREARIAEAEVTFVEALRKAIAPQTQDVPTIVGRFIEWSEDLRESRPGQCDPLFPWLANEASVEQMRWFLLQEVAGEAGFEDLLALTQVKVPVQAKLEMARNFWDEMGRGSEKGMHGPMLARLADHFKLFPTPETVVPESLALGNTMIALASHRRYAFHSVGALRALL